MCLAIPGKILEVKNAGGDPLDRTAKVSFGGTVREVSLAFVPEAEQGEYVIVHVGFAISRVDEEEARRVFDYVKEVEGLEGISS